MKNKFRASYSVLSMWRSGNWERAIKAYFKLEDFTTPAMLAGRDLHSTWNNETLKTGALPAVFGGKKLASPEPELKIVVSITNWLDLVGIIDLYDKPEIHEYKSGVTSSESYASSPQGGVYGVLATLSKRYADKIYIHHYDQYAKRADTSIVWLTDKLLRDSLNWIETNASEMHAYLLENRLYERFGKI